jgi:anaerobic magnesium-protoporphyrin IX monomethyl ester cyclase
MMRDLKDAGLQMVLIGFESGSDRVLKYLRKGCTRAQNLEAARICHDLGIKIWANYMLGLPTETREEALETYSMIRQIRPYHCSPAFYTPHPGSDLFETGKKAGIHLLTNPAGFRRNRYDPKIKGPDYRFLIGVLYRSMAIGKSLMPGPRTSVHPDAGQQPLF